VTLSRPGSLTCGGHAQNTTPSAHQVTRAQPYGRIAAVLGDREIAARVPISAPDGPHQQPGTADTNARSSVVVSTASSITPHRVKRSRRRWWIR
jgi:hypothetical protein